MIKVKVKYGHKIMSTRFPYGWRKYFDLFIKKYPIRNRIELVIQRSYGNFWYTYRKTRKTVQTGNHIFLEHTVTKDIKHLIHVWMYAPNPIKTFLHELAHAYLEEQDEWHTEFDYRYNTEENADKLAADILYGAEMPKYERSVSGMTTKEIKQWMTD